MMSKRTSRSGKPKRIRAAFAPVGVIGAFLFAATWAIAGQGWMPTVSVGSSPKKEATLTSVLRSAPTKDAGHLGEMSGASTAPNLPASDVEPGKAVSFIETGSTAKHSGADEYCANISSPAADARFAWQRKLLTDLEQQIAGRVALLEERTAEYKRWVARRDEFSQKANETLLRIYARMRPDAAAPQLAALDEEAAAAILTKLEPRIASLILNEMDATKAARLSSIISGAAKVAPAVAAKPVAEARTQ